MVNGALVQIIMASRVLYGLSRRGLAPSILSQVHPQRRTPLYATAVAGLVVAVLAFSGALGSLAVAASTVTLFVFALVNAALLAVRLRKEPAPEGGFRAPLGVPALGLVVSLAVATGSILSAF